MEPSSTRQRLCEAAKWFIEYGATLVPSAWNEKHPITKGWQNTTPDLMTDEYISQQLTSTGMLVLCGISGAPIIVDIDSPHLIEAIEKHLPRTPIRVRTPRGGIHLWYGQGPTHIPTMRRREGAADAPKHERIEIDVQSTGTCVMLPPSRHPNGGEYELIWDKAYFDELGITKWSDLPHLNQDDIEWLKTFNRIAPHLQVVKGDLADVKVSAIDAPVAEGSRHITLVSLMGQWLNETGDTNILLDRAYAWNDRNPVPLPEGEVFTCVVGMHSKHYTGLHKAGTLRKEIARFIPPPPTPEEQISIESIVWIAPTGKKIDEELLCPPGFEDVMEYILATSPQPSRLFATQAALSLGSVLGGRLWRTNVNNNFTSMYFVNVGQSGSGKDRPQRAVDDILMACDMKELIGPDGGYTGATAIHEQLLKHPVHYTKYDEFGDMLRVVNATNQSFAFEGIKLLKTVWGSAGSVVTGKIYAKHADDRPMIYKPAVTILGSTTPNTFYKSLTLSDLEGGLIPRLLIAESLEKRKEPKPCPDVPVPSNVIEIAKIIRANPFGNMPVSLGGEIDVVPRIIEEDHGALAIYSQLFAKIEQEEKRLKDSELFIMLNRTQEKAMRIGAILALFDNPSKPVVTAKMADWACRYAWTLDMQTTQHLEYRLSGSEYGRMRSAFLEAIRATGLRGLTNRDIGRQKPFTTIREKERKEIFQDLCSADLIRFGPCADMGRKRMSWVALAPKD